MAGRFQFAYVILILCMPASLAGCTSPPEALYMMASSYRLATRPDAALTTTDRDATYTLWRVHNDYGGGEKVTSVRLKKGQPIGFVDDKQLAGGADELVSVAGDDHMVLEPGNYRWYRPKSPGETVVETAYQLKSIGGTSLIMNR